MKPKSTTLPLKEDDVFSDSDLDGFLEEDLIGQPTGPPVHLFMAAGAHFVEGMDDVAIEQSLRARGSPPPKQWGANSPPHLAALPIRNIWAHGSNWPRVTQWKCSNWPKFQ